MQRAFLLTCAAYAGLVAASAWWLPARVPLHFGGSGEPDRWGSRTEALWTFGLVGAGVAVLLGGLAALTARLPLRSSLVNIPHKDWWTATEEREAEARRRLRNDLYGFGAATMLFLGTMVVNTGIAARSDEPSLGWSFALATGLFVVGVLAWAGWTTFARYRPEEAR
ncbi:DUF1648 domain-containing protein [Nocardioides ferulae]|uniref:DUF1648 domain-containing protein n=1 Tax=Nocardioides ferulae TaxID=2340821 RepID=UPI0013DE315A|nr:DUF1648 domain-containing protein [Nocardioides ferulae]